MRQKWIVSRMAFMVVAFSISFVGSELAIAGGGSWGGSLGFGSRGFGSGGSWGGFRGGPVRNFFAHRQPIRNTLRGIRGRFAYRGGFGSRGWGGSAGYGSVGGYGSIGAGGSVGGYGSVGYQYYSGGSVGYGSNSFSYGSVGHGHSHASPVSYSSGFASSSAISYAPVGTTTGCIDCVGGTVPSIPYGQYNQTIYPTDGSVIGDGTIIQGDQTIYPADQYYDSTGQSTLDGSTIEGSTLDDASEGSGLRGFENPPTPTPEPADGGDETTSIFRNGDAILKVNLPKEARLYVNGQLTKTKGSMRSYVSRNLRAGKDYSFNLDAVVVRDGEEIELSKQAVLRAGDSTAIDFDFDQPILTQLTVRVPEEAKVELCGNGTTATGAIRNFKTKLKPGKVWQDYSIEVSFERDGEIVTEKRTLTIEAGEKYVVDFSDKDLFVSK